MTEVGTSERAVTPKRLPAPARGSRPLVLAGAIALWLVPFAVVLWRSSRLTALWDLSYILEHAWRISTGDVPYRDFFIPHPPLTFIVQALIIKLPGSTYAYHVFYCGAVAGLTAVLVNRILACQLREAAAPNPEGYALLLSVPVTLLNGYCILSQPFYDPDCACSVLAALWLLLGARSRGVSPWGHFVAGVAMVVPIFVKQNIGMASFAAFHGLLALSALAARQRSERRMYAWYAAGSLVALSVALLAIHVAIGLGAYYEWTVRFALQQRPQSGRRVLFIYEKPLTWLAVGCAVCGVLASVVRKRMRAQLWLGLALVALPFGYATFKMVGSSLAWRAPYFWALGLVGGTLAAAATCWRRGLRFEAALPFAVAGIVHASFMSQGVGGSSYGVWPFLVVALAAPAGILLRHAAQPDRRPVTALVVAVVAMLTVVGYLHVARGERLGFVDRQGDVQHATLPALAGLAAPGTYVADLERLVRRTELLIPRGDNVVVLPGEDPFFFATRRHPQFPATTFDDTVTPYGADRLLRMLGERRVQWLIIKTRLQILKAPWTPLSSLDLSRDFSMVESLPGYTIFTRRQDRPAPSSLRNEQ